MIIDYKNKLVFIATTKTASTSIESILRPLNYCGAFVGSPRLKHTKYQQYIGLKTALGLEGFKTWSVVRHPVDKAKSWFNYRSRSEIKNSPRYLGNLSYKEYLNSMTPGDRNECNDALWVTADDHTQVDLIFNLSDFNEMLTFLKETYNIDNLPRKNTSQGFDQNYEPNEAEIGLASDVLKNEIHSFENLPNMTASEARDILKAKG